MGETQLLHTVFIMSFLCLPTCIVLTPPWKIPLTTPLYTRFLRYPLTRLSAFCFTIYISRPPLRIPVLGISQIRVRLSSSITSTPFDFICLSVFLSYSGSRCVIFFFTYCLPAVSSPYSFVLNPPKSYPGNGTKCSRVGLRYRDKSK